MLSRYVVSLGSAVFAVVAGAYILWGPSKKRPKDKCRGLVNLGNSCFLNSLLQSWAACPSLYNWLRNSASPENVGAISNVLGGTVFKVLQVLNNEIEDAPDPFNPSEVFQALRAKRWVITSEEQDTHELFHVMTETLEEEASSYPGLLSLFDVQHLQFTAELRYMHLSADTSDFFRHLLTGLTFPGHAWFKNPTNVYQSEKHARTRSQGLLPVLPVRLVEQPTRGLLASQLQCMTCGARSAVKYDVFDSLSLSFPRNYWGSLSLDNLLSQFITPEVVQMVECVECAKVAKATSAKSNFRKKVSIGKLPQVLCIHLPRTQWLDNGAPVKRFDHVSFPETLYMDQYLYCRQRRGAGDTGGLQGGMDITLQMLSRTARPVTAPTSAAVNLLRTLNFDQHFTQTGLFVHPQRAPQIPSDLSDVNHNAPPEVIKSSAAEYSYRLAAVVCHLGDVQLGHFVAYRRGVHTGRDVQGGGDLGSKWWLASDSSVQRVSIQQVLSSEAYMLFYEKL